MCRLAAAWHAWHATPALPAACLSLVLGSSCGSVEASLLLHAACSSLSCSWQHVCREVIGAVSFESEKQLRNSMLWAWQ